MIKLSDTKKAVVDDTLLYIWKNASELGLNDMNRLIQELIEVMEVD